MNPTANRRMDVVDVMLIAFTNLIGDGDYHRFDDLIKGITHQQRYSVYDRIAAEYLPWLRPFLGVIGSQLHINLSAPIPEVGRGIIAFWYPANGANLATGAPLIINISTYENGLVHDAYYSEPFTRDYYNEALSMHGARVLAAISEKTGPIIQFVHQRSLN